MSRTLVLRAAESPGLCNTLPRFGAHLFRHRRGPHGSVLVWVVDKKLKKYPLRHAERPYLEADGTGFEWGYGGHGPTALTRSILADALDGDLVLADELDQLKDGFFEKFILNHPLEKSLKITRATVLRWLKETGKFSLFMERRKVLPERLAAHAKTIAEREELLSRIQDTGAFSAAVLDEPVL